MGGGGGRGGGPGALLGTEVCAALLMLCWLCCWSDDASEASSSPKHPRKPVIVESGSRRRSGDIFCRRIASSAVSLHLPSTSGHAKQPLSAHRSHEEIRRRKSHHDANETETRYHSAPSVIDEVIHRRDWERSTKDLYIPLNPENECIKTLKSDSSTSPDAPTAEPESSSVECLQEPVRKCKKHHTNIKSSKGKCKESNKDDIKDTDATEASSNFYIGDAESTILSKTEDLEDSTEYERLVEERNRSIYKAKDAKQCFNESIKLKEMPRKSLVPVEEGQVSQGWHYGREGEGEMWREHSFLDDVIDGIDRSGAIHHSIESRLSFSRPYPPPSVETVGYEGGACYLAEVGSLSALRARGALAGVEVEGGGGGEGGGGACSMRARHASDGDILAPPHRPESGAFSESDLDLEVEGSEERPPAYHELQLYAAAAAAAAPDKKETAI